VFLGGYHGGVLYFASGPAPWNAPYEFVIAPYNDLPGTLALIEEHGETLAAVIMEAMLGSGGCVPADGEFVRGVAAAARAKGALFIADEVMTSRHGRKGMMDLLGVTPDITTYGKYIGGGFSFGAFGGKAEYLDQYDTSPEGGRTETISHAGTFNNNVSTMTAGGVVLGEVFTADVAEAHTARGNDFRENVAALCARHSTPVSVSGFGSMMSLHGLRTAPTTPREGWKRNNDINELLFLGLLERGVYIAARGMMNVGLAHTDEQLATALDRLDDLLSELDAL
jgi:glutamate-1-semialdehyde 2,1-aminomutase